MQTKNLWLAAIAGLLLLGCAEQEPTFPWIHDLETKVEANGRMVGYEFYAKW
ncbi:MAG: hypothetical protein L3J79_01780 [Candidatus Marinimicrobia bacterium]|nr:hypothetical protein [Candidatus Neomarinimicrobiota bacterium]